MHAQRPSIFTQYAINFSSAAEKTPPILKDHPQIPYILDVLNRKENHHLLIEGFSSEKIYFSLLESIAFHLQNDTTSIIYFDVRRFSLAHEKPEQLMHDFLDFCNAASVANKHIIIAISDASILKNTSDTIGQLLQSKLFDEQWRILVLKQEHQDHTDIPSFFTRLRLNEITENEMLALLKTFRHPLETFHHVEIPDEILPYALSLTTHYLGGKSRLDKTLELLDSSAARARLIENNDPAAPPILTTHLLAHVVSSWTQIALSHLHHNKFKLSKFLPHIQQKIIGQDAAINAVGSLLQSNCIKLREKKGTACNLLLTGPAGVGKKEFVIALAEYLFGNKESLLQVILNKHQDNASLSDVLVNNYSSKSQPLHLLEAIQSKPYAIVLFENLNNVSENVIGLFRDIFTQGYVFDKNGTLYDFRHAIIVITSTLGADSITALTQKQPEVTSTPIMDLMQLVLNENTHHLTPQPYLSQQDLRQHILPALQTCFSTDILRHSHIIPFVPLDQTCLEKIIKTKLILFAKSLEENFGIELSYAPEVIKFLAHELIKQNENAQAIEKLFEQYVYVSIANEILAHIEEKNRPKRLALLLNETGQLLHAEFIVTHESTLYTI